MTRLLQLLEGLREDVASGRFPSEVAAQRQTDPEYLRTLEASLNLINRAQRGDGLALYMLREVMSTSDFAHITGDIMNRVLLAQYQAYPSFWRLIAEDVTVADFHNVHSVSWGELAGLLPTVVELAPYPAASLDEGAVEWGVVKHGIRVPFSWELALQDNLRALRMIPTQLGQQAVRSVDYLTTTLFAGPTGPLSTIYNADNANIINTDNGALDDNPPLSIDGLQDAWTVLGNAKDAKGNPIVITEAVLVVPPALRVIAQNILNATQITIGADSAGQRLTTNNWMKNGLTLVVDPWLPIIDTTHGSTAWYLFPRVGSGRPVLQIGHLRGHEQPEIWLKSPNAVKVGGGPVDPLEGDFDTDAIQYRMRYVYGGAAVDERSTVASNGSGS